MALQFDARAVLQEFENGGVILLKLLNLLKLMPPQPKFRSFRSFRKAVPHNCITFCLDGFAERVAIAEHDGGLVLAEAETIAAQAEGFAAHQAAARHWLNRLSILASANP